MAASGSGSQLPAYAGGAARAIWIVGAQKVVPDLGTPCAGSKSTPSRLERPHPGGLRVRQLVNRLLILNAEPRPGRSTILLLREAIGF